MFDLKGAVLINIKKRKMDASMTVEAAFVLPIFLYAMAVFLYIFQVIHLQQSIQSALNQTAGYFTKNAYVYEKIYEKVEGKAEALLDESTLKLIEQSGVKEMLSGHLFKQKFKSYINEEKINHSMIQGGMKGISIHLQSDYFGDREMDLTAYYECTFPVPFFQISPYVCVQRVSMKNWTGHEATKLYMESVKDEPESTSVVYMTENGSRYHTHQDCTHIKLSVQSTTYGEAKCARNKNNVKYKRCSICGRNIALTDDSVVYITDAGECYHCSSTCSGIKRNVTTIPIDQLPAGTPWCKRCKKRDGGTSIVNQTAGS